MVRNEVSGSARQTATASKLPDAARAPRQTRGQARVDAILDTAAAVIVEEGVAGVTMHALARRARTSIGSLYHFFPDRDSVLEALCERHAAAIAQINRQFGQTSAAVWRQLSVAAAIEHLVKPYVEYLRRRGDYLQLMQKRMSAVDDADFIRTIRYMLDARLPGIEPAERQDHAAMLHAIAAGAMQVGFQADPGRADMYLREIPRVLTMYLADIEAEAAARR